MQVFGSVLISLSEASTQSVHCPVPLERMYWMHEVPVMEYLPQGLLPKNVMSIYLLQTSIQDILHLSLHQFTTVMKRWCPNPEVH
jgi:hypothetical protein